MEALGLQSTTIQLFALGALTFDTQQDTLRSRFVWVRIPCLSIEYYDHAFLMKIGNKIGRPIKVHGCSHKRGFPRALRTTMFKPLLSKFKLRNRIRRIEYEGIHLVCFECGRFGHRVGECPSLVHKIVMTSNNAQESTVGINKPNPVQGPPNPVIAEPVCNPEVVESYGPWMLAKPRYRKGDRTTYTKFHGNIRKNDGGNPRRRETITTACNRSRYSVLLVNDPL